MKKLYLLLLLPLFTYCTGNQKPVSTPDIEVKTAPLPLMDESPMPDSDIKEIINEIREEKNTISGRTIFYPAYKLDDDGGYYIEKVGFFMLHEPDILFDDLDMEPYMFRVADITYQGDNVINMSFDAQSSGYYRQMLYGELSSKWFDIYQDWYVAARMERDPETLVWTIYHIYPDGREQEHKWQVIESGDIISSRHRYVNMETRRHDTEKEIVDWMPDPLPESILQGNIPYKYMLVTDPKYFTDTENYQPFLGSWLLLDTADMGYIVYHHLEEDGNEYIPTTLQIEPNTIYYSSYWESFDIPFEEVRYYEDGTILLYKNGSTMFAMKWKDKPQGLAWWSMYYSDGRIMNNEAYVQEDMNIYPVVDYDTLSKYLK